MFDVLLDFFESNAVKNHWVLLVSLLVISCVIGCLATAFIIHKVYIPWKTNEMKELKNKISALEKDKEQLSNKFDSLNNEYNKLHERCKTSAIEIDYEDYQNHHLGDNVFDEFLKK